MLAFKLFFMFSTLLGASMDADGWVTLDRPKKSIPATEEVDPSIWVVFSKKLGSEKILIRFPEDPGYRYLTETGDEMEIIASSAHAEHRLQILAPQTALKTLHERTYMHDGMWHFERWITTSHHTYFLQTKAASMDAISHEKFVGSFEIETSHS